MEELKDLILSSKLFWPFQWHLQELKESESNKNQVWELESLGFCLNSCFTTFEM